MSAPAPVTVNVPAEWLLLPDSPTAPMSVPAGKRLRRAVRSLLLRAVIALASRLPLGAAFALGGLALGIEAGIRLVQHHQAAGATSSAVPRAMPISSEMIW